MRLEPADNIRFICITGVILAHSASTGVYLLHQVPLADWWIADIINSSLRFVLPLFILLSGALNLNNNYDTFTFYRKRFFRVILPFVFWGFLFSLAFYSYYLYDKRPVSLFSLLGDFIFYKGVFKVQEYHLWFVYVLIGIYLLTPVIKIFTKNLNQKKIRIFGLIWIIVLIINTFTINNTVLLYFFRFFAYTGYYIAGFIFLKTDTQIRNKMLHFVVYIITVGFMAVSTYYLTKRDGILNEHFNQTASVTVFISSIAMYRLISFKKIESRIFKNIRDEINRYGLGIYIIHATVLNLIEFSGLGWNFIHPFIGIPVTAIICIFVSYLIIRTMHKIPFLKDVAG